MSRRVEFVLRNNLPLPVTLNVDPEGAFVPWESGAEVTVVDVCETTPVTLILAAIAEGELVLSVWPGDGTVTVTKGGLAIGVQRFVQRSVSGVFAGTAGVSPASSASEEPAGRRRSQGRTGHEPLDR